MHPYDGQDPITPGLYISGKGYWVVPNVADDNDDRDAATMMIVAEGALDRTNWIGWRMVNGLEDGGPYPANIEWSGNHDFGGQAIFQSYVQFNDEVVFAVLAKFTGWPGFVATTQVKRRAWCIAATTFDGAGDTLPSAYVSYYSTGAPATRSTGTQLSTRKSTVELLELPGGGELVSVKIKCVGAIVWASGQTNPTFTLVSWADGVAPTLLSSAVATTHNSGTWLSVLESTVTPSSTVTIDKDLRYGILITHPYGASANAAAWFLSFVSTSNLTTIPK